MEQHTHIPESSADFEEKMNKLGFKVTIVLSLIALVLSLSFGLAAAAISKDDSENSSLSKQVPNGIDSLLNSDDPEQLKLVFNYIQQAVHGLAEVNSTIPQDNCFGNYLWTSDYIDNMPLIP